MAGIEQFYSELNTAGVFHPYRFKVSIVNRALDEMKAQGYFNKGTLADKFNSFFFNAVNSSTGNNQSTRGTPAKSADDKFTFFAQSTALPGKRVSEVEAHFLGMTFSLPFNMSYDRELQLSVICDSNLVSRKFCEEWMDVHAALKKAGGGIKGLLDVNIDLVLLNTMLDNANPIETYHLVGCWPKNLGDMTLDHSSTGHSVFNLNVAYQFFDNGDSSSAPSN